MQLDNANQCQACCLCHTPAAVVLPGKLHFISYNFDKAPFVTYGVLNVDGNLEKSIAVDLPRPVMMHDFAITAHHAIFMDLPLCFDGEVRQGLRE